MAERLSTQALTGLVERQLLVVQGIQRELQHASDVLGVLNTLLQQRVEPVGEPAPAADEGISPEAAQAWLNEGLDTPEAP